MKTFRYLMIAALGLVMSACSSDIAPEQPTANPQGKGIPFTATISMGGSTTRSVMTEDTENNTISAAWETGDELALVYEVSGQKQVTKAKMTTILDDQSATITATIAEGVTAGTKVTLLYPYSAVCVDAEDAAYGTMNKDALSEQDGRLETIAKNYDLCQGSGEFTLSSDGTASLKADVTMASQIAIWKLTLTTDGTNALNTDQLNVVKDGDENNLFVVANLKEGTKTNVFYIAVPAISNVEIGFQVPGDYSYSKKGVTLKAGYYYQSTVKLHPNIKYIEASWNSTDHKVDLNEKTLSDASQYTLVTSSTTDVTWSAGTYVVSSDASISGKITLDGNVDLILCDGKTLTVNGRIAGGDKSLNIYGQTAGTGKLTIDGGGSYIDIVVQNLEIHGGDITGTNCDQAITTNGTFKMYHGSVSATAQSIGLFVYNGGLSIYGGTITTSSTASSTASSTWAYAVYVYNAAMEMTGGSLKATSTGANNHGIVVAKDISISGGTVIAEGGTSTTSDGGNGIHGMSDIKICGTANVTATGGDGAGTGHGGYGIYAYNSHSIEISGGTVNATGGGGSDGHAIKSGGATGNVCIKGGTVTATATGTNGNGIDSNAIDYYGGRAEATGAGSGWGINGRLTNKTSGSVTIKTKLTGGEADWTKSDIGPGNYREPSQLHFRCIKINM